jgi:hypothetical protein
VETAQTISQAVDRGESLKQRTQYHPSGRRRVSRHLKQQPSGRRMVESILSNRYAVGYDSEALLRWRAIIVEYCFDPPIRLEVDVHPNLLAAAAKVQTNWKIHFKYVLTDLATNFAGYLYRTLRYFVTSFEACGNNFWLPS